MGCRRCCILIFLPALVFLLLPLLLLSLTFDFVCRRCADIVCCLCSGYFAAAAAAAAIGGGKAALLADAYIYIYVHTRIHVCVCMLQNCGGCCFCKKANQARHHDERVGSVRSRDSDV